jgi:hypothetical protein
VRIPSVSEIPALDRQAIYDGVAPYRNMTTAELDDARNALCRMATEQRSRWSERAGARDTVCDRRLDRARGLGLRARDG